MVVLVGALFASQRGGGSHLASPTAVKHAFARRGITVRYTGEMIGNPSVGIQPPLGELTTRLNAISSGNLDILVLRSLRDAERLGALRKNLSNRDECGRSLSSDVYSWRVKNVIVTYDRCDFSRKPFRLASAASLAAVESALGDLGSYSLSR